jgi:uncharacterized protein
MTQPPNVRGAAVLLLALGLLPLGGGCGERADPPPSPYVQEIERWHAERVQRLEAEDGWLTLIGLFPLEAGAYTLGAAAGEVDLVIEAAVPPLVGTLMVQADSVRFTAAPGVAVRLAEEGDDAGGGADGDDGAAGAAADTAVAAPPTVRLEGDRDGRPTVLRVGTVRFHVIERGEQRFLRVKDSDSAVRRAFRGIERFPIDGRFRVTARLETRGLPRTVPIPDVLGRIEEQPCPGLLVFQLAGDTHRLIPIGEPGEPLFIIFGDRTSGATTYGGGRYLYADPPGPDGTVVLDFNRAYNPPCVFTPYATCPLPPAENLLPIAVAAGEKAWGHQH